MAKPILCLDFDGVIHSYTSGWKGADVILDPPVPGAIGFICSAVEHFTVAIYSSRSCQDGGREAMHAYVADAMYREMYPETADKIMDQIEWPTEKPPAMVTIDDRALTFDGTWPAVGDLLAFKPWNKKELGATGTFPMGKIHDTDEGALKVGVTYDSVNGIVLVKFGKSTAWVGMPPENAIQFARTILKAAGAKTVTIEI